MGQKNKKLWTTYTNLRDYTARCNGGGDVSNDVQISFHSLFWCCVMVTADAAERQQPAAELFLFFWPKKPSASVSRFSWLWPKPQWLYKGWKPEHATKGKSLQSCHIRAVSCTESAHIHVNVFLFSICFWSVFEYRIFVSCEVYHHSCQICFHPTFITQRLFFCNAH